MTQRVRDGLGLPAGFYRINDDGPTVYVPSGVTADHVESLVCANVVPVSGGFDMVSYDSTNNVFVKAGNPNPSPTHFNREASDFLDNVLHEIFNTAQPESDFPYQIVSSETRANIVDDLETLQADFVLTI
jgi:hypothetical protein